MIAIVVAVCAPVQWATFSALACSAVWAEEISEAGYAAGEKEILAEESSRVQAKYEYGMKKLAKARSEEAKGSTSKAARRYGDAIEAFAHLKKRYEVGVQTSELIGRKITECESAKKRMGVEEVQKEEGAAKVREVAAAPKYEEPKIFRQATPVKEEIAEKEIAKEVVVAAEPEAEDLYIDKINELTSKLMEYKGQLREKEAKIVPLKRSARQLLDEKKGIEAKFEEKNKELTEVQQEMVLLQSEREAAYEKMCSAEEKYDDFQKECRNLLDKIKMFEFENESLKNLKKEEGSKKTKRLLADLRKRLEEEEEKSRSLRKDLKAAKEKLLAEKTVSNKHQKELEVDLKAAAELFKEREKELKKAKRENEKYEEDLKVLSEEGKVAKDYGISNLQDLVEKHQSLKERLERSERQRDEYKKALKRVWMWGAEEVSAGVGDDEEFEEIFEASKEDKAEASKGTKVLTEGEAGIDNKEPTQDITATTPEGAEEVIESIGALIAIGTIDTICYDYDVLTAYVSLSVKEETIPEGEPLYIIHKNNEKAKLVVAQRYRPLNSLVCEIRPLTKAFEVREGDEVVMAKQ